MANWILQLHDGDKLLPELIVEGELMHDAQRAYCEFFGIDRNACNGAHGNTWGVPWWKTHDEDHDYYSEPHLSHNRSDNPLRPIPEAEHGKQ